MFKEEWVCVFGPSGGPMADQYPLSAPLLDQEVVQKDVRGFPIMHNRFAQHSFLHQKHLNSSRPVPRTFFWCHLPRTHCSKITLDWDKICNILSLGRVFPRFSFPVKGFFGSFSRSDVRSKVRDVVCVRIVKPSEANNVCIENAEGYVLIAVYLFIYLFVCVLFAKLKKYW